MNISEIWQYLLLGGALGACGQGIRAFLGKKKDERKKAYEAARKNADSIQNASSPANIDDSLSWKEIFIQLFLGFIAGVIAMLLAVNIEASASLKENQITTKIIMATIAAGYAGADFIENAMKTALPGSNKS